tara:strand:- start:571 stop:741 length:171 start_codon:yes stop_codon:yes gene_type:complete
MESIMWKLILKKDIGDVEINSYKTKKEAEEELQTRERLTQHLTGFSTQRVYEIKKG